jgi:predicted secreted Zn-dependent protease
VRRSSVLTTLLLAACASAPRVDVPRVPPGVRLSTRIDFYDIPGTTVSALRADITHSGPRIDDRSWAGSTNWNAHWSWEYDRRGISGCGIRRASVQLSTVTLLPRWTPEDAFDRKVLSWWTDFSAGLAEHERGHVLIAVDGARDIVRALESMSAGTCEQLGNNANTQARLVVDRVNRRQAEFDLVTGHGRRLVPPDSIAVR